jgi:crotonobetainyl-CoA:carnitine CoA-transferase CaiB-like acyl-CoA transferase
MRALDGIRVLEIGQYISAPYCAMLLADQGAEVIKIERPKVGDPRRSYDPLITDGDRSTSGGFFSYNRNKRSVTLNLADARGQDVLRRLAQKADVVVENLRPGTMEARGLGPGDLCDTNPRLIYAAISGYGRDPERVGPYSARPAFDAAIQATSGVMSLTGERDGPPSLTVVGFADIYTALCASLSISLALITRERTGRGGVIDQAMYDSVASLVERSLMLYDFVGEVTTRGKDGFAPVGALRALDGYVASIIPTDEMWRRLCEAIDRPDLVARPDLQTVRQRSELFRDVVVPEVEKWTTSRSREEIVNTLSRAGLPAGEVATVDEIYHGAQAEARRLFLDINDPVAGNRRSMRTPAIVPGTDSPPTEPPPALGEATSWVLTELLGEDDETVARWRTEGVV